MIKFLPGRHVIDSFGNGGFRFGGMSHQGSLLVLPSGMQACAAKTVAEITEEDLTLIIAEKSAIDFLLIGTGVDMHHLRSGLDKILKSEAIHADIMSTNAAVRTYNVILAEQRRVAALMIAVDKAHG